MRVILACAIVALLPAAPAVLAAKDGPDDAVAEPQGGFLQRFGESLGDYNRANAPGLYDAQSRALSAMGIGGSVAVQMDGNLEVCGLQAAAPCRCKDCRGVGADAGGSPVQGAQILGALYSKILPTIHEKSAISVQSQQQRWNARLSLT